MLYGNFYKCIDLHFFMVRCIEELGSLFFERRNRMINNLSKAGFNVQPKGHVYVANPHDEHPKIGGQILPVAYIGKSYFRLVNLDEESFKRTHDKLREIYENTCLSLDIF